MSCKALKKFYNNAPREKEKATNLELPSSFNGNGGDHGISLQGDQTTNNKTGLSLNDEDEGCNHQATMPYCSLINKKNILGCGTAFILFLIAVVTVTMKMNVGVDSNSSKQVAFIGGGEEGKGLSSAESVTYEFTFVGDGTCVDGRDRGGMPYDFIQIDFSTITSAEACGEQCAICPGERAGVKLRGFNFLERSYCLCLLEDGLEFNTTSLCPGATKTFDDSIGSGPIKTVVLGPPGQQCWSASEVINEPTASPSKDRPRPPTPTMVPTKSPPVIDGFTLFGNGTCLDGNDAFYDYIVFSGVQDAAACGEQCLSCPGKRDGVKLRGFNFLKEKESCQCLLENGLDFNTTSLCPNATSSYDDSTGSGPIQALSGQVGQCWSASEVINEPIEDTNPAVTLSQHPGGVWR